MTVSQSVPRRKVSREGLVLIKSFEGFTPRAMRRIDGLWVIGYGHTKSAREGLSVSEADAELLLQYDLLPVVAALHDAVKVDLNQHQFDALASFALSVGVEAFAASDVLSALNAEGPEAAARVLGARIDVDPGLSRPGRRRAVERALFEADPDGPVALAQLLAAPVEVEPAALQPASTSQPEVAQPPATEPDAAVPVGLRVRYAAISQLLGESEPDDGARAAPASGAGEAPSTPEPEQAAVEVQQPAPTGPAEDATDQDQTTEAGAEAEAPSPEPAAELTDGPPAAAPDEAARAAAMAEMLRRQFSPFPGAMYGALPLAPVKAEAAETPVEPAVPPKAEPAPPPPIHTPRFNAPEVLVLTPAEVEPAPPPARPAWTAEEREAAEARQDVAVDLFTEEELAADVSLGPVLRHEDLEEPPRSLEFGQIGAYAGMGAVGLVSLGAAVPALQALLDQGAGPSGEMLLIFAALTLIGGGCSGIAAYNLVRLWRRHQHRDA
ncbi:MAG: glycoside hydrolase family protein [Brevundimonas sp.]